MPVMSFLARMKVHADREQEFVECCNALTEKVLENEPDTLYYRFYKLREPLSYAVFESFTSEAAEEAHQQTAYFKEIAPRLIACLDGPYVREYLDPLE